MGKAVVIMSGGLDSVTTAHLASREHSEVFGLSINYGQTLVKELEMAKINGQKLEFKKHVILKVPINEIGAGALIDGTKIPKDRGLHDMQKEIPSTYITFRNGILLSLAIAFAEANDCTSIYGGWTVVDFCLPGSTKVMVRKGLKNLSDLRVGDLLLSYNPKTFMIEEKPIIMHTLSPHQEELLEITLEGDMKFRCTNNHHMLRVDFDRIYGEMENKHITIVEAKDLQVGDNTLLPRYAQPPLPSIPEELDRRIDILDLVLAQKETRKIKYDEEYIWSKSKHKQPRYLSGRQLIEFLGWYITEGSSEFCKTQEGDNTLGASIWQSLKANPKNYADILDLLKSLFRTLNITDEGFTFSGPLALLLKYCGERSFNKQIPQYFFDMFHGKESHQLLFDVLIKGNGSYNPTYPAQRDYWSTSIELIHQVNFLGICLGFRCSTSKSLAENENSRDCYWMALYRSGNKHKLQRTLGDASLVKVKKIEYVPNTEELYDLTVKDNHTLIAGQEGLIICSQSGYPDCRKEFLQAMEKAANLGTKMSAQEGKKIEIIAPLLYLNKRDIIRKGLKLGVDYSKTWSCYEGGVKPCGQCDSCRLREQGFRELGCTDPLLLGE